MPYIMTDDGVQLFYKDEGSGEKTLLLLHGYIGNTEHYRKVAPALAEKYRVVRYDHRGNGRSETPSHGYSMKRMAQDCKDLIDHLGLTNITIVGWSMGSQVIYAYLKEYGDSNFEKIVITVMTPRMINDSDYRLGQIDNSVQMQYEVLKMYNADFQGAVGMAIEGCFFEAEKYPQEISWMKEDIKVLDVGAMIRTQIALHEVDHWDVLPTITKPVLLIGTDHDIFPAAAMEEQQRRIKNSRLVMFENCGHMHAFEYPEKFVQTLTDFVG